MIEETKREKGNRGLPKKHQLAQGAGCELKGKTHGRKGITTTSGRHSGEGGKRRGTKGLPSVKQTPLSDKNPTSNASRGAIQKRTKGAFMGETFGKSHQNSLRPLRPSIQVRNEKETWRGIHDRGKQKTPVPRK